jgi:hypothetical protein
MGLMVLIDVNVLVYAHRGECHDHAAYRKWLQAQVGNNEPFGVSDLVLSGFLRVVTHPKIFKTPTPFEEAVQAVLKLRLHPNCILISPGPRHWEIFVQLCRATGAKGNLVPDAYLAALAIESGCEWVTTDRDYSRFPGLRVRHPLQS